MKKKRADFFHALKAHWSIKVAIGVWAILGVGSTGLTYAPQSWQDKAYVGQYIPRISPSVWIIGFLILFIIVLFEAAFKAYATAHEAQQTATIGQSSPPPVIGNSSATGGSASASIGDIHIHPPGQLQQPIPRLIPVTQKPTPKTYCLEMRDPLNETVYFDKDEVWRIGVVVGSRRPTKAILLPLYFNPMKSDGIEMKFAQAHLIFTSTDLKHPITV
jgi:hypothetical protein